MHGIVILITVMLHNNIIVQSKVLLISFDGFRYDYLNKTTNITNFKKLIDSGVTMPYMNNSFVTKTFPSHYTMATGLFEESHGVIGNKMYDSEHDAYFSYTSTEPFWWDGGEPIWVTAVKSNLKAGVYYWPGSEGAVRGVRPNQYRKYNSSVPFSERVTTMVQWLSQDGYDLGVQYFEEPDASGHIYGPDSPEVINAIERMDAVLGQFLTEIEAAGLKDTINIIVTSDHGMTTVNVSSKLIQITDYANSSLFLYVVDEGAAANLVPREGKTVELVQALTGVDHVHVMLKEDIPDRFHYKNGKRVMPVFAYADEGWMITGNATTRQKLVNKGDRGEHGYDNELPNMKPFFIASGPAFKTGGQRVDPIQSVDIYPLICHLLNTSAALNNGSLNRALSLLRDDTPTKSNNGANGVGSILFLHILSSYLALLIEPMVLEVF